LSTLSTVTGPSILLRAGARVRVRARARVRVSGRCGGGA